MLRRAFALLMVVCILSVYQMPVDALECIPEANEHIIEYSTGNLETVRIFERGDYLNAKGNINRDTLSGQLLKLGLEPETINSLSEAEWEEIEGSPRILTITSYQKSDINGSRVSVTEKEAMSVTSTYVPPGSDEVITEYLKLVVLVIQMGNDPGGFRVTASTRWLTMPLTRFTDSIGLCLQNFSITPNTVEGYYNFDIRTIYNYTGQVIETPNISHTMSSDDFVYNGSSSSGLVGTGFAFTLPSDGHYSMNSTICYDFYVQLTFRGHVNYPSLESYFNVYATYCHSKLVPTLTPGIDFISSGSSIGFGLGAGVNYDNTYAMVEMHYVP